MTRKMMKDEHDCEQAGQAERTQANSSLTTDYQRRPLRSWRVTLNPEVVASIRGALGPDGHPLVADNETLIEVLADFVGLVRTSNWQVINERCLDFDAAAKSFGWQVGLWFAAALAYHFGC